MMTLARWRRASLLKTQEVRSWRSGGSEYLAGVQGKRLIQAPFLIIFFITTKSTHIDSRDPYFCHISAACSTVASCVQVPLKLRRLRKSICRAPVPFLSCRQTFCSCHELSGTACLEHFSGAEGSLTPTSATPKTNPSQMMKLHQTTLLLIVMALSKRMCTCCLKINCRTAFPV